MSHYFPKMFTIGICMVCDSPSLLSTLGFTVIFRTTEYLYPFISCVISSTTL